MPSSSGGAGGAQKRNWKSTLHLFVTCATSLLVLRNGCSLRTWQRNS